MGGTGGIGGLGGVVTLGQPELSVQLDSAIIWLDAPAIGAVDDAAVTAWVNKGTLGDFSEATNPPVYKTGIQNGLAVVRFDGTDVISASDADGFDLVDTGFSIFCVYQSAVDAIGIIGHYDAGPAAGWAFGQGIIAGTADTLTLWADDKAAWVEDNATLGDASFHLGSVTNTALGAVQFYRGVTAGATNTGCTLDASAEDIHISADGVGASLGAMDVGELLMFNTVLGAASVALVQNYLIARWGL